MEQAVESQELVKRFLLGQLADEDHAIIEERVFTDQNYFRELLLVEGELIDDFVFGTLSDDDQERMQTHFLVVPERLENLRITKAIERYVSRPLLNDSDSDWEGTLRDAQKNRDLLESLISEDWLGLKVLVLLRTSPRTRSELGANIEDPGADIAPILGRLVSIDLVNRVDDRFSCTKLGADTLRNLEHSLPDLLTR